MSTPRAVLFSPKPAHIFDTVFGEGGIVVGPGDGEVVMTMTPAAADTLARLIALGASLHGLAGPVDVDDACSQATWTGVVLDLVTASALCQPPPAPKLVRRPGVDNIPAATSW